MARQAPVTAERIERAMDEVALAIDMAGDRGIVYLPIYERLALELAAVLQQRNTMAAVSARLARLTRENVSSGQL